MSLKSGIWRVESPDLTTSPLEEVPLDTVYDVLRNERRRLVLYYLLEDPAHEASIGELATQVAAWENNLVVEDVTPKLRKRTYNALQQTHLPKLDDSKVVEYDRTREHVWLSSDPKQLRIFLSGIPRSGTKWFRTALTVEFLVLSILVVKWTSAHVFGVISPPLTPTLSGVVLWALFVLHVFLLYQFR